NPNNMLNFIMRAKLSRICVNNRQLFKRSAGLYFNFAKNFQMKKLLAIIFLVAVIYGTWWLFFKDKNRVNTKEEPIKVAGHSSAFNTGIDAALNSYFDMKTAFVNADTLKIKEHSKAFIALIDGIKMNEMNNDTSAIYQSATMQISDIKANAIAMLAETDITEMRQDFRMVSENLYPFLKTIKYEGPTLYWQNCPMAFGENKEANWLSNTKEIINPYMGVNHPEYKSAMLHCGEVKDTIK
ncbi:MAG: DUF3347 domain-containing protein, partial [Ginsengibacter sp.]